MRLPPATGGAQVPPRPGGAYVAPRLGGLWLRLYSSAARLTASVDLSSSSFTALHRQVSMHRHVSDPQWQVSMHARREHKTHHISPVRTSGKGRAWLPLR